jgi:hypothetical protein
MIYTLTNLQTWISIFCLSAGMRVIGVATMLPEDELQLQTPNLMRGAITYVSVADLINL